jgi:hypothetical protein
VQCSAVRYCHCSAASSTAYERHFVARISRCRCLLLEEAWFAALILGNSASEAADPKANNLSTPLRSSPPPPTSITTHSTTVNPALIEAFFPLTAHASLPLRQVPAIATSSASLHSQTGHKETTAWDKLITGSSPPTQPSFPQLDNQFSKSVRRHFDTYNYQTKGEAAPAACTALRPKTMGACMSTNTEQEDQRKRSQMIDKTLEEDSRRLRRECKILLLGMLSAGQNEGHFPANISSKGPERAENRPLSSR